MRTSQVAADTQSTAGSCGCLAMRQHRANDAQLGQRNRERTSLWCLSPMQARRFENGTQQACNNCEIGRSEPSRTSRKTKGAWLHSMHRQCAACRQVARRLRQSIASVRIDVRQQRGVKTKTSMHIHISTSIQQRLIRPKSSDAVALLETAILCVVWQRPETSGCAQPCREGARSSHRDAGAIRQPEVRRSTHAEPGAAQYATHTLRRQLHKLPLMAPVGEGASRILASLLGARFHWLRAQPWTTM